MQKQVFYPSHGKCILLKVTSERLLPIKILEWTFQIFWTFWIRMMEVYLLGSSRNRELADVAVFLCFFFLHLWLLMACVNWVKGKNSSKYWELLAIKQQTRLVAEFLHTNESYLASQVVLIVKNPLPSAGDKRHRINPWDGKILWRRAWQPTPVSLLGETHGSLVGYSPCGCKESDSTEVAEHPRLQWVTSPTFLEH